ncbi:OpcA/G6PD domain-containing protein, partial [Pseudarthrobacter sp. YAF2]|uniref:OpcA/G6PD domain-containing protein n=1 Tax=Pseudarthrobacter sp. YAF2 TaxID=3233078 RepID=UPI003F98E2B9
RVRLTRPGGDVQLFRPGLSVAELTQPGQPAQRITLPRRSLRDCLAEELRRLDPDSVFGEVLTAVGRAAMEVPAEAAPALAAPNPLQGCLVVV